jgi:acyl carrier protein
MRTIGIISDKEEYQDFRIEGADMVQIEEEELMALLDIYCKPSQAIPVPTKSQVLVGTVTPADLQTRGTEVPDVMDRPLFSTFSIHTTAEHMAPNSAEDLATVFLRTETETARADVVITALSKKLARSLSMPVDDIDTGKALFEYGVDSLVAVELRNWTGKNFGADIPVFDIMGGATITAVGALVSSKSTTRALPKNTVKEAA